jgi:protein TonB
MSYLDQRADSRRRTTAIAGVIVVHSLLGYALLTGLAEVAFKHVPVWRPIIDFPVPPEPTPTPEPSQSAEPTPRDEPIVAPRPPIPTPTDNGVKVETFDGTITEPIIPVPIPKFTPIPLAPPTFAPRAAAPRNDPARWVVTDDYPSRDLREGNEGTTVFRVVVGSNGRVSACEIVRSSGHPDLDAATCKAVTRRARFDPATDGNGEKAVGTYSNSVRWQIPR